MSDHDDITCRPGRRRLNLVPLISVDGGDGAAIMVVLGLTLVALGWTVLLVLAGSHATDRFGDWLGFG